MSKLFNKINSALKPEKSSLFMMILNSVFPTLCVIAYLCCGFLIPDNEGWHPTWLIFFLLPIYYTLVEAVKKKNGSIFAFPFLAVGLYLLAGFMRDDLWRKCWVFLFSIPLYYLLCEAIKNKKFSQIIDAVIPIICITIFLVLGLFYDLWHPGWVVFFVVPLYYQVEYAVKKYNRQQKSANQRKTSGVHDSSYAEPISEEEYNNRRK